MDCFPKYSRSCNHVLPTIFEESLSYEEQICKLVYCMKELENIVNNIQDLNKEYVDEQVQGAKDYSDSQLANAKLELVQQFTEKIDEVYVYINQMDGELRDKLLSEVSRLEREIDDIVIGDIYIFDPTVGYKRNIDTVINSIYNILRVWGLSATQYDTLRLDAEEYDSKMLTARNYDVFGYRELFKNPAHFMNSPYNGEYLPLQDVIMQVVDGRRQNGITAEEYFMLNWSASEYDEKKITAYDYDWNFMGLFFSKNLFTMENIVLADGVMYTNYSNDVIWYVYTTKPFSANETIWNLRLQNVKGKTIKYAIRTGYWGFVKINGVPLPTSVSESIVSETDEFILECRYVNEAPTGNVQLFTGSLIIEN